MTAHFAAQIFAPAPAIFLTLTAAMLPIIADKPAAVLLAAVIRIQAILAAVAALAVDAAVLLLATVTPP